jgi:DNA polymerase-3 subunit epsilon
MAKNIWKGLSSYNLKSLCNQHHIQFDHHRAAADSKATAELILIGLQEFGIVEHEGLKLRRINKVLRLK